MERRISPRLFTLDPEWCHLASFFLAPTPQPVRDAVEGFRRKLEENPFDFLSNNGESLDDRVRRYAASYLEVEEQNIALVGSTTEGLALVYSGLDLKEGDEILFSPHDHYSLKQSLKYREERSRIQLSSMNLYPKRGAVSREAMCGALAASITPSTRVVHLTWVHSGTGVRLPLKRLTEVIAELNDKRDEEARIITIVDGVHGLGVVDESVKSLGANLFISGTHKWIFGPRGTGIIWGDDIGWGRIRPVVPPFAPISRREPGIRFTPGGFHSFENRWALADAFLFMTETTRRYSAEYTSFLNTHLKERLLSLNDITLHTPLDPQLSAGLTCFTSRKRQASEVVLALLQRRIAANLAPGTRYVRMGPGIINGVSDIDRVIDALREILY